MGVSAERCTRHRPEEQQQHLSAEDLIQDVSVSEKTLDRQEHMPHAVQAALLDRTASTGWNVVVYGMDSAACSFLLKSKSEFSLKAV